MPDAFDRIYSLAIGKNQVLVNKTIPLPLTKPSVSISPIGVITSTTDPNFPGQDTINIIEQTTNLGYTDFNAKPNDALIINELRITASIQYTKEGGTNKQGSIIEIYNLIEENQKFISSGDIVLLRAGYRSIDGSSPPLIFSGQVKSVSSEKKGQDTVTKLICTATDIPAKNIRFSKTPIRGETNIDVAHYFAAVAAANGIPTARVFIADEVTFPSGYSASGSLWPAMEKFCKKFNLNNYVTLGRLYIEPEAVTAPAVAKVIIDELNVKGSIRSEDDASGETSSDPAKKSGIVLNTFLNGNITPAKLLNINFGEYRGDYLISSVQHKLDLEGNDWDTIISCKRRTQ